MGAVELSVADPDRSVEYWQPATGPRVHELWEGRVMQRMTTLPLDVDDLLSELDDPATEPFEGLPEGTTVGHVHFCVAAIPDTVAFYRDVLGMDLTAQIDAVAAFLSAG